MTVIKSNLKLSSVLLMVGAVGELQAQDISLIQKYHELKKNGYSTSYNIKTYSPFESKDIISKTSDGKVKIRSQSTFLNDKPSTITAFIGKDLGNGFFLTESQMNFNITQKGESVYSESYNRKSDPLDIFYYSGEDSVYVSFPPVFKGNAYVNKHPNVKLSYSYVSLNDYVHNYEESTKVVLKDDSPYRIISPGVYQNVKQNEDDKTSATLIFSPDKKKLLADYYTDG